jgi:hypothetical protein
MEEEEAAVNKREGTGRKAQCIIAMIYDGDEGTNMSDESHEKGRKKRSRVVIWEQKHTLIPQ